MSLRGEVEKPEKYRKGGNIGTKKLNLFFIRAQLEPEQSSRARRRAGLTGCWKWHLSEGFLCKPGGPWPVFPSYL